MKIKKVTENEIVFTNGKCIYYSHEQDCCETNYADFGQLELSAYEVEFDEGNMVFEYSRDYGFRFGSLNTPMFFVPCYSWQNGYYDPTLDIYYDGKRVLTVSGELIGE